MWTNEAVSFSKASLLFDSWSMHIYKTTGSVLALIKASSVFIIVSYISLYLFKETKMSTALSQPEQRY